ncbi:MAG: pitrilysin family protein, partial [Nitrospiraceae bacterium]|nr:pitrilysin family protein [Nitrospiraceae bacterium]
MYRKDTLSNGIRVVSESMPKVRSVSIGIWVKVGSRHEQPEVGGVSHFIEHMFFKGTQKRTAKDIATEIDSLGGEMNAFTSQETTTYYVKVLDEHLAAGIDILSDILLGSKFDPQEMEKERKVILEEIKMVEDTPDDYIHELFTGTVWQGNPLGRPILGTKETIKALKHKDVLAYIEQNYCPGDMVISVAGNFEHDRLIEILESAFGSLSRKGSSRQEAPPEFRREILVKKKQLEQVQICLGCKGLHYSHDDRYTVLALNAVLGNSMSSRLFQEVREQNALAYSIYSYVTAYRDAGLVTVYAGTDPANAIQALKLIIKEIRKLRDEGITPAEETRVKNQIKGNLVLSLETSNSHMSRIARQEIYFG